MFYNYPSTFSFDDFKESLQKEDYDNFIYNCYFAPNQEEILLFLEKFLNQNNFIINYIYVRNTYKLNKFNDPDIIRKCLSIAIKTIFIVIAHINICSEINKKFDVLDILVKKIDEKFNGYITSDILEFAINHSKKDILSLIDTMSSNIPLTSPNILNDKKKLLDLPEPQIICNISAGSWRYPAIKYNKFTEVMEKENSDKFIKNYSARCQKYYEAYQYVNEKLKLIKNDFSENNKINLSKYFL